MLKSTVKTWAYVERFFIACNPWNEVQKVVPGIGNRICKCVEVRMSLFREPGLPFFLTGIGNRGAGVRIGLCLSDVDVYSGGCGIGE
jgi:hypothetical protein